MDQIGSLPLEISNFLGEADKRVTDRIQKLPGGMHSCIWVLFWNMVQGGGLFYSDDKESLPTY